jgi:hypothetical protein
MLPARAWAEKCRWYIYRYRTSTGRVSALFTSFFYFLVLERFLIQLEVTVVSSDMSQGTSNKNEYKMSQGIFHEPSGSEGTMGSGVQGHFWSFFSESIWKDFVLELN